MNPIMRAYSRRATLKGAAAGFGYLAFAGLSTWAAEKENPLAPKKTHFPDGTYRGTVYVVTPLGALVRDLLKAEKAI